MHVINLFHQISFPLCFGALLSFILERLLYPKSPAIWRLPEGALFIHLGLWILAFSLLLAINRRPHFAAANVSVLLFLLVLISNAKYQALKEPLIFQDFNVLLYPFKYPRMYLPFFGMVRFCLVTITIGGAVFLGLTMEQSLLESFPPTTFGFVVMTFCFIGGLLIWLGSKKDLPLVLNPEIDLSRLGLLACLWRYSSEERKPFSFPHARIFLTPPIPRYLDLPHLVVVESESFFDIRRCFPAIRPEILRNFDLLKNDSISHGLLEVPAWGANTMRSEFAFLSGIENNTLGIHRFNPYRYLKNQKVPSLASYLKRLGYRTVCIHPHYCEFFDRNKVFPRLGFDEFMDIKSFNGAPKSGPYVGDVALANQVSQLLKGHAENSMQPIFLFIITMENHGPLGLEKVEPSEISHYYDSTPTVGYNELTIYLRHLVNSDAMIKILRVCLQSLDRNSYFCFFGDHVPIMKKVYKFGRTPDGLTDYIIWSKERSLNKSVNRKMDIWNLSSLLLLEMGILNPNDLLPGVS